MINTIVIDTETMDVRPSALILSIGAFAFDVADLEGTRESILTVSRDPDISGHSANAFYRLLDANDQLMLGRSVSKDTQHWWRNQKQDAKESLSGNRGSLADHLLNLSSWIAKHIGVTIYFRGTDFDGSILESAYRSCRMECPWKYNGKRDVRTYIDVLTGSKKGYVPDHQPYFQMIKHNALHDAMNDAEQMAIAKNYLAAVVKVA